MKTRLFLVVLFALPICLTAQTQSEFPHGIYLSGVRNIDTSQIRQGLNASWIVSVTKNEGESQTYTNLITNGSGLRVIAAHIPSIAAKSRGQHLEYEAEQGSTDPLRNYFANRPVGETESDHRLARIGASAGYMIQDPQPNFQWNYYPDVSHYYVTFVVKVLPGQFSDTTKVARFEIHCNDVGYQQDLVQPVVKSYSDFSDGLWKNIVVEFDRTIPSPVIMKKLGVLRGTIPLPDPPASHTCENIDIRVYWYGNVETSIDKVIVEDDVGKQLYSGQSTTLLQTDAQELNGYSLVKRFYSQDEPFVSSFTSFKYVKDRIGEVIPSSLNQDGKGSLTTALAYEPSRFLTHAQPNELMMDNYPIRSDIPSPVYKNNTSASTDLGIVDYVNDAQYTSILQQKIDERLIYDVGHNLGLRPMAEACANTGFDGKKRNFWFIGQLHGEYIVDNGKFRYTSSFVDSNGYALRPPTGNEIKMMLNLALAYGAKGFVCYPFGTDLADDFGGGSHAYFPGLVSKTPDANNILNDHSTDIASLPVGSIQGTPKNVWVGYSEKWNALKGVYDMVQQLAPTFLSLTWQGTKSWNNNATAGTWSGFVNNVTTNVSGETKYVETGYFKDGSSNDYVFVVNRRTLSTETRTITLQFSNTPYSQITDVATSSTSIISPNGIFATSLSPGQGKLYKITVITPLAPTIVSPADNATNQVTAPIVTWNAVSGVTSYQIQISKTASFGAGDILYDVTVGNNILSYTVPGLITNTQYWCRVKGWNSTIQGAASTNHFTTENTVRVNTTWSGQITLSQAAYIYSPGTLTISAGTTITQTSLYANIIVVSGYLKVQGTANQHVVFDGVNANQWNFPYSQIWANGSGNVEINYAEFKKAKYGVNSLSCTGNLTVTNSIFNGYDGLFNGLYFDGFGINIFESEYNDPLNVGSINISANTFTSNNQLEYGIILWNVRPSSMTISNNTFSNLHAGIYSFGGGAGSISGGSISNCQYGIYEEGPSPNISSVTFSLNTYAIYFHSSGSQTIRGCLFNLSAYCNGIYSESSSPTISCNTFNSGINPPPQNTTAVRVTSGRATVDSNTVTSIYGGIGLYSLNTAESPSYIRGNVISNAFSGVTAYGVPYGVVIKDNIIQQVAADGYGVYSYGYESIQNNRIVGNESHGSGIFTAGYYAPTIIQRNQINNLYRGLWFYYGTPGTYDYSYNNFEDNTIHVLNYTGNYFMVRNNWWGSSDENVIMTKLNAMYAYYYTPWLTSPATGTGPYAKTVQSNKEIVKIASEGPEAIPKEFALKQNYPNPFNPTTLIRYDLPEDSYVSLKVYDMLGREVKTIVDQDQGAGSHSASWDGGNAKGELVSSGVYMYSVTALRKSDGKQVAQVQKMILAR